MVSTCLLYFFVRTVSFYDSAVLTIDRAKHLVKCHFEQPTTGHANLASSESQLVARQRDPLLKGIS
jgi:hypothetical protein